MRLLLGPVNQVVALLGRLIGIPRLMGRHDVVRVMGLLVLVLLGLSLHDGWLDNWISL